MLDMLLKASKEAVSECPIADIMPVNARDHSTILQSVAEGAAHKMFGLLIIDRPLRDSLGDLLGRYEKQYADGLDSFNNDLAELTAN